RAQRTLDYLCTLPEWDGERVLVMGSSQGGAQTAALAGMDPRVKVAVLTVPAMMDMGGKLAGRASGWKNDVRKTHPYAMYGAVEWEQVTLTDSDSMARYLVHIQEMYQSLNIIEQLIDNIPAGDFYVKQKPVIRVPEGQWYFSVEGASGEFGVYLDSKGDKSPYRMKMRPMGLSLVGAMDKMLRGQKIADLVTTGAAIDFVIPDIDR
ncbi:MAG: acetylxylan esterase, partial [Bacteroidales bacterium]|nr:acetylxylan esterase [Bacteroidales bacterium]